MEDISVETQLGWYRQMCLIRAFEREVYQLNTAGLVRGTAHLYIGMEAIAVGLDPAVIDVVRNRKPLVGIGDKETTIIQLARDIGGHRVRAETYSRALTTFSEPILVDIVSLMGQYAATATRLSAVNQQLPPGWKQFLPLPFTPPPDIHPDSRSRLTLIRAPAAAGTTVPALGSLAGTLAHELPSGCKVSREYR